MNESEKELLELLKTEFDSNARALNAKSMADMTNHIEGLEDVSKIAKGLRRLHSSKLIDEKSTTPNDPEKIKTTYVINDEGLNYLNPDSIEKKRIKRENQLFKMQKFNTALTIIATAAAVITVIVVLTQIG